MENKLAIFDMDGTLIPGTTAAQEIAKVSKTLPQIRRLEKIYSQNKIDSMEFSIRANRIWADYGTSLYEQAWSASPKLSNIYSTLTNLRDHGYITCLITMAPYQFARFFTGFDHVYGSSYGNNIINPEDKPKITFSLQSKYKITPTNTFACGDSHSDIPLFKELENTIAINASDELKSLAKVIYNGSDLQEAMSLLIPEELIDG